MATMFQRGRAFVLQFDLDGKRKTLSIGAVPKKHADSVKGKIESLIHSRLSGYSVDPEVSQWLGKIDSKLTKKLADIGLIERRDAELLSEFIDAYIQSRGDLKARSINRLENARDKMLAYFGKDRPIKTITRADVDSWKAAMLKKGLAENTARRALGRGKQFLAHAVKAGLLEKNPFADVACNVKANRARDFFVTEEIARKVLEKLPSVEWRLVFALCRYGALRCPSEVLALRWSDILWDENKMMVRSPKLERYPDKAVRVIPVFKELAPFLCEQWKQAPKGTEFVVQKTRSDESNLRTTLGKYIKRAGVAIWPKLFQNLRSSRVTELSASYPSYLVAQWAGHSEQISDMHYKQALDEHFTKAAGENKFSAVKALRTEAVRGRMEGTKEFQGNPRGLSEVPSIPHLTSICNPDPLLANSVPIPPRGVEPLFSD